MKFSEVVSQTLAWLQREGRVSYRALRLEFDLNEDVLDALKEEIRQLTNEAKDLRSACNAYRDGLRQIREITNDNVTYEPKENTARGNR